MARNKYDFDEQLQAKFNRGHLKRMLGYVKIYIKEIIFTIILMLISSFASLTNPMIIERIMDVYIPNKDISGIVNMGLLMLLILIIGIVCQKLRMYYMNTAGQGIIHRMRFDVFSNIQRLSFDYFDSRPHGKIIIRVVNYINSLSDLFSNGIINVITDIFVLFVSIFFMLSIDVRLTLIALSGMPVLILAVGLLKNIQRKTHQTYSNKLSNLNAYIHESISGIKVTQSFAREEENLEIFTQLGNETKKSWYRFTSINLLIFPIVEVISNLTICLVYVAAVLWFNQNNSPIKVGALIAFINYIWRFWQPINTISNFYNAIINNMSYLERIFETMDEKPEIIDLPDAFDIPEIEGRVEFKNVTFSYTEGQEILKDLSFNVNPGERIALVGQTGAGKTTITSLISRFYDVTDGKVLIDGYNVKDVTLYSLRKQMGVMMQDSFIFSGNIIDNIRYGNFEATDEQVIEAAKAVCADEFIQFLPQGYYTEVTERGSTLSAGQRQLISFARALLANPKILILDEATSSIDTKTEMALQQGLERLLANRTSFIIAHRLSTIKNASQIMVIGDGGILEQGTHAELLKSKGNYYNLYKAQFSFLQN